MSKSIKAQLREAHEKYVIFIANASLAELVDSLLDLYETAESGLICETAGAKTLDGDLSALKDKIAMIRARLETLEKAAS